MTSYPLFATNYKKRQYPGNWYEGLRQLQSIMFQTKLWTLERIEEYLKRRNLIYLKKPKTLTRKNISYYKYMLRDPNEDMIAFKDYEADHIGFGVVEITAVNFWDT